MSEHIASPRITAPNLDAFVNKHVSIVGKVTQLRGDQATIDADGTVTILLNREAHLTNGNAALFIGKVNPDLSIKALSSRDVGANVDMGLCSQVAEVTQRYKALFGGADN
ncbi:DNA replication factor A subunit Ssb3 [Cordyceps militaris CM01]|uniref:DNA replication factor A subunit Ssb3 n=2 Tax=Cordyceps militaris TaxID=73501 RepID=G3JU85_CORMM|nr:DNA replication factor A subunit Ssb3 [Cordyceps militaris CM01]ATY59421.1 DNA replication factor A subunit Ssb3 [Cordyceps militaris]EGX87792.1 DNA replication factor A subunit Ssb3 [Cordyceps militaris CM01]